MAKRNVLYGLLAAVGILFILYALVQNYILDPEASAFLDYKAGAVREPNVPVWLKVMDVHVAFACIAMATGLLNFSNRIYGKSRRFHRVNGYVYLVSVLVVVATSGYMAPYATGGRIGSMGFNLMNLLWPFFTVMAIIQIRKKRADSHRNWMIRSYAFCFTNLLIHLITALLHQGAGVGYALSYTIAIYGTITLLLLAAQLVIRTVAVARR
ncbi:DUF2306 domain-containing protein [Paenibacillus cymbidii]|uniref:DUF2306 domain-containing protein n=1 Tax=Paenibacillus cymbidii TaxID=1639034 RepID=UPI0010807D19|nr:DUF2306 domain-containing protein [Paenibacillus cymbidii]